MIKPKIMIERVDLKNLKTFPTAAVAPSLTTINNNKNETQNKMIFSTLNNTYRASSEILIFIAKKFFPMFP